MSLDVVAPEGFDVYDVPGDGNCFYTSLSLVLGDFQQIWSPDEVVVMKKRLLRRLYFLWRETEGEDADSLDTDLQVVFQDLKLPERLATDFSWAETSEIILMSRLLRRPIHVWVLYPGRPHSILGLKTEPPGWPSCEPVHLWNVVTRSGRNDHYYALKPRTHHPLPFMNMLESESLLYASLSLGCLAGMVQAVVGSQR